jgi:hypothetical protein
VVRPELHEFARKMGANLCNSGRKTFNPLIINGFRNPQSPFRNPKCIG